MSNLNAIDFITISERDYQLCVYAEKQLPDEFAVQAVTYHIQQAIEKSLKGLILLYGENPPYTHNIQKLRLQCEKLNISLCNDIELIEDTLTLWESDSRYDPYISFSESKYKLAKKVYSDIHSQLKAELLIIDNEALNLAESEGLSR